MLPNALTAAPLGSRTVRIICQRLLQPTGRFRRRSLPGAALAEDPLADVAGSPAV